MSVDSNNNGKCDSNDKPIYANASVTNQSNQVSTLNQDDSDNHCVSSIIGDTGAWQHKFLYFYMFAYLISPFQNYGIIFFTARSDFWCTDQAQNMTEAQQSGLINKCFKNCTYYDYDRSSFYSTIVNEWNLICDQSYLASTATSSYQVGYLVSSLLIGLCSDNFGRKKTLIGTFILEIISGYGQAFAPSIRFFIVSRFFLGIAAYGRYLTGKLLVMEMVGPTKRSVYALSVEYSWYLSCFLMTGIFYLFPYFRYVQFGVTTYQLLSLTAINMAPESIRWLLSKGKYQRARKLIFEAVEANSVANPSLKLNYEDKVNRIVNYYANQRNNQNSKKQRTSIRMMYEMFQVSGMFKVILSIYFCWFCGGLLSYSMTYNLSKFGSNLYINFLFVTLSSTVCVTILNFLIERYNRKMFATFAYATIFVVCIVLSYVFAYHPKSPIRLILSMIFSFCSTILYHTILLITSETFPTETRQFAVGWCSVMSRVGTILAPFTIEFSKMTSVSLLFAIFAGLEFVALIVSRQLNETRGKDIPNTVIDCRISAQKQKQIKQVNAIA